MIISASNNLYNNKKKIDELNVFPVPDGDTGTNMSLTISSVKKALLDVESLNAGDVAKIASSASLRGARGNSGVILSQLIRGFAKTVAEKESIDAYDISNAFVEATKTAYDAVQKPTEGTILTVARRMSQRCEGLDKDRDVHDFIKEVIKEGKKALEETTEMLPQLKAAGVVDAGGKGLMTALEGAVYYLDTGLLVICKENLRAAAEPKKKAEVKEEIKFGYCTEFIINKKDNNVNPKKLRAKLEKIGDCVVVVDDDDIIKVHVHSNNPGIAIEEALKLGSLINIKIDNMREQSHRQTLENVEEKRETPKVKDAFISVAAGEGLIQMFKELGCSEIIEGGQTMNPSTEDFVEKIEALNAENIYIFPNNKNIILAAEQAKELSGKNIAVIGTTSVVQGIASLLAFNEDSSFEENVKAFNEAKDSVKSGSVTFAARDCSIDSLEIKKDDVMGLVEGKICAIGSEKQDVLRQVIDSMCGGNNGIVSVYCGEGADEAEVEKCRNKLEQLYPDADITVYNGGQPLYYYFVSVE